METITQEDKKLLLKDLCARLPYGLCVQDEYGDVIHVSYNNVHFANYFDSILNGTIKPYLFPLSSMTEEQKREFDISMDMGYAAAYNEEANCANRMIDFFNKNHFDYRGLIPKGLALDATGLNIY